MPTTEEQKIAFRNKTQDVFEQIQNQIGIKSIIALVQAAHESNWGVSELASLGFNLYGMTPGTKWLAAMNDKVAITPEVVPVWSSLGSPTISFPTTEYSKYSPEHIRYFEFAGDIISKKDDGHGGSILTVERYFRKYANWDESAWDWARHISRSAIYLAAFDAAKGGDVPGYGAAVGKAGYATDGNYAQGIISIAHQVAALPLV